MNNIFMDYQQQFFKPWNEYLSKMMNNDSFKNMAEMVPGANYYQKMWKQFNDMMPDPNSFMKIFPYQIPGMDSFGKLYDLWKEFNNSATFTEDFQKKYMDLMSDVINWYLPQNMQGMFGNTVDFMNSCVNYYQQSLSPWMEINQDILSKIAAGDMTAYSDFFEEFEKNFDETFEKYSNMMGMSFNREFNDDMMHAINSFYKAMIASGKLIASITTTATNDMNTMVKKFQADFEADEVPTTFRDFYNTWYKVTGESLETLLSTDKYAELFGDFSDKYFKYVTSMKKIYDCMLEQLPIPRV